MQWIGPLKKYELQINDQSWKRGIKNVWPEENESLKNKRETLGNERKRIIKGEINEEERIEEKMKNLWE